MGADYRAATIPAARERSGRRDVHSRLSVGRHDRGGRSSVTVVGEIDLGTAPLVYATLAGCVAGAMRSIEADLSAVEFCDWAGLTAIPGARGRAAARGGCPRLHSLQPALAPLFELPGAGGVLLEGRAPGVSPMWGGPG